MQCGKWYSMSQLHLWSFCGAWLFSIQLTNIHLLHWHWPKFDHSWEVIFNVVLNNSKFTLFKLWVPLVIIIQRRWFFSQISSMMRWALSIPHWSVGVGGLWWAPQRGPLVIMCTAHATSSLYNRNWKELVWQCKINAIRADVSCHLTRHKVFPTNIQCKLKPVKL